MYISCLWFFLSLSFLSFHYITCLEHINFYLLYLFFSSFLLAYASPHTHHYCSLSLLAFFSAPRKKRRKYSQNRIGMEKEERERERETENMQQWFFAFLLLSPHASFLIPQSLFFLLPYFSFTFSFFFLGRKKWNWVSGIEWMIKEEKMLFEGAGKSEGEKMPSAYVLLYT